MMFYQVSCGMIYEAAYKRKTDLSLSPLSLKNTSKRAGIHALRGKWKDREGKKRKEVERGG